MGRTTRLVTAVLALVALYASLVGPRAVALAAGGGPGERLVGWLILLIPVAAIAYLVVDIRLDGAVRRMREVLWSEGAVPEDDRDTEVAPGQAGPWVDRLEAWTTATPDDWRVWFQLGRGYALTGERRRSREAFREAAQLFRRDGR